MIRTHYDDLFADDAALRARAKALAELSLSQPSGATTS